MSSIHSYAQANNSTRQMTDHPEWRRMVREIATLRQINAELAEKVSILELQLEGFLGEDLHDEASPKDQFTEPEPAQDPMERSNCNRSLSNCSAEMTVDWREADGLKDASGSPVSHKRKSELVAGKDPVGTEARRDSAVKRRKTSSTPDLSPCLINAYPLDVISAIINPAGIASNPYSNPQDASDSSVPHQRKSDLSSGGDHVGTEAAMDVEVKRRTTSFTPGLSPCMIDSYPLDIISAILNPAGTALDLCASVYQQVSHANHLLPDAVKLPLSNRAKDHGSHTIPSQALSSQTTPVAQKQNWPLAYYHSGLPQIDRTKASKEFYIDLQNKFIIAGFDEERFSCWCHVEKGKRGLATALSVSHTGVQGGKMWRYRSSAWFHHAEYCRFYRDPWATTAQGQRVFPSFPLPKPGGTIISSRHLDEICPNREDKSPIGNGSAAGPK